MASAATFRAAVAGGSTRTRTTCTTARRAGAAPIRAALRPPHPSHAHSTSVRRRRAGSVSASDESKINALTKESIEEWEELMSQKGACPAEGCLSDLTVKDLMSRATLTLKPDDSFMTALELLVKHHKTGLPVIDDDNHVLGIVSAYDILALDCTPGRMSKPDGYFPDVSMDLDFETKEAMWQGFTERKNGIEKETARTIDKVMRPATILYQEASVDDAADLMVQKKAHRIVITDQDDKLIGILTRSDILKATLRNFRWYLDEK